MVLALAKEHQCDSCQEVRLPIPHSGVSLEKSDVLWHTLQMDFGQLTVGDDVLHVLFMVDEASHFMNVCEVFRRPKSESRNATTPEVIHALETVWIQNHGYPNVLKFDPEGAFRGVNLQVWGQERGVDMQPCAAEDHGAIGDVESLLGKIKMDVRTFLRDNTCDPMSGVLHVVAAHNCMDRIGGFAPVQWAYGRFPTLDNRLFDGGRELPVLSSQGTPDTSMRASLVLRTKAEELYRKSQAAQRISRALNSKPRRQERFLPGDLVYYKRYKTPAQALSHPGLGSTGKPTLSRWYGPARVLATETRTSETAKHLAYRPGHIIWIVAAGRLKRCSQHQLRHCSERERLIVEASGGYMTYPWSFTEVLQQVEKGNYDIYDDLEEEQKGGLPGLKDASLPTRPTRSRSRPRARSATGVRVSERVTESSGRFVEVETKTIGRREPLGQKEYDKRPLKTIDVRDAARRDDSKMETRPLKTTDDKNAASRKESENVASRSDVGVSSRSEAVKRASSVGVQQLQSDFQKFVTDPTFDLPMESSTPSDRPDRLASQGAVGSSGASHGVSESELASHPPFVRAQQRRQNETGQLLVESPSGDNFVADNHEDMSYVFTVSVDVPEDPKEIKKFSRDSVAWMAAQMKKSLRCDYPS